LSSRAAKSASVTEALSFVDPRRLPRSVHREMQELGPYLTAGLTFKEIGRLLGTDDEAVSVRVAELREALTEHVLRQRGVPQRLRARLEAERRSA
jgi:hypothetical protein